MKYNIRDLVYETMYSNTMVSDLNIITRYLQNVNKIPDSDLGLTGVTEESLQEEGKFEEYFKPNLKNILKHLWLNSYGPTRDKLTAINKLYNKMSVTKYISVNPEEIGKDKTFYFLGTRYTKSITFNKVCSYYNWTKSTTPESADFIILGENIKWETAKININLDYPVVMDESIRVHYHFLFNLGPDPTSKINQSLVASYLNVGAYNQLKFVTQMINFLDKDALDSGNKFRLIRSYLSAFTQVDFNLRNKEHVWLSDTIQKYCHPQHRALVTNVYLKSLSFRAYQGLKKVNDKYKFIVYDHNNLNLSVPSGVKNFPFIHSCEGMDEVYESDISEGTSYSLAYKNGMPEGVDYVTMNKVTYVPKSLYKVSIGIQGLNKINLYVSTSKGVAEIVSCGINFTPYVLSPVSSSVFELIDRDKWEASYDSEIYPIFMEILSFYEVTENLDLTLPCHIRHLFPSILKLDRLYSELYLIPSNRLDNLIRLKNNENRQELARNLI